VTSTASTTNITGYNQFGQALSSMQTTGGTPYSFSYAYNLDGGMSSTTFPSGRVLTYGFDGAGRVDAVSGVLNSNTTNYINTSTPISYAPQGAIASMTFGNGLTESTTFNGKLQPTQIQAGSLLTLQYGYPSTANNGNLQSQTITRGSWTATQSYSGSYDGVNRLTAATETGPGTTWSENYGFDAQGNRWVSSRSASLPSLTLETPIAQSWYPSANKINTWTYDLAGNVQQVSSMARSFTYDAENRQVTATINSNTTTYVYDGDGRRIQKVDPTGATTTFVYDAQGQLVAEYGPPTDSGTTYVTADHLGSTRLTTDSNGLTKTCYDYLPFGEEIQAGIDGRPSCYPTSSAFPQSPDILSEKFTSKERDAETGLDFFDARYMSSAQGRFTSPDPLGGELTNPQSLNRYSYVLNNPLRFTDPTGLYVCKDGKDGACDSDQDKAFEKSLDALRGSKNGDVARAAASYGAAGDTNGVTVGFADLGKTGEGGVTLSTLSADANGKLFAKSDVTINSSSTGTALSADIGHEGSHVADAQDMVRGITITGGGSSFKVGTDISQYSSEQRAYRVTDTIYRSANEPYNGCGNANCALGAGSSPIGMGQRIDQILLAHPNLYHSSDGKPLTQKNQGGNVLNLVVPH
jgi:RHS repeat-associated protein